MSAFSDSYVLRVLFATPAPACGLDALARRWRRPRTSPLDPYRSQQYHMRGRWDTGEMRTADYYRKQRQIFARMASSATDVESANRYRAFAFDYLAKAEKLEPTTGVVVALSNHNDHRDAVSVADGRLIEGIGASFDVPKHDVQMAQAGLAALSR